MKSASKPNSTLAEIATDFLASLPPEDREKAQIEVHKFVRWFGLHRKVGEISPLDIASYGEHVTLSAAEPLKSFLSYIHKIGATRVNLATHLRTKKASQKATIIPQQGSQVITTLTREGYTKLEAELTALKNQRPQITEELHKAAADKDFRENAPLEAAREHKAYLEGRIQELEATLKSAKIIDKNQSSAKIKIGDTVMLHDLACAKKLHCLLVDPKEAKPMLGKISIASPLGKALLGKERGQIVKVTAPAGTFSYRIEDVHQGTS